MLVISSYWAQNPRLHVCEAPFVSRLLKILSYLSL